MGPMGKHPKSGEVEVLRSAPMFSALDEAEARQLLSECLTRSYKAGQVLFSPSRTADAFFVILTGQVKLYKLSAKGDEQILHLYGPGATFGEAAMWAGGNYPAFAEVIRDAALLVVSRDKLQRLLTGNPALAMGIMAGLSAKLREFAGLIEQLSLKEVPARLAAALLGQAEKAGGNVFKLAGTKRHLAAQIGTVAETLSRAFSRLKSDGLVDVRGSQITILDFEALADLAEHG